MVSQGLLDDPEFLAELDKLDVAAPVPERDARFVDYVRPTMDEWTRDEQIDRVSSSASEAHTAPGASRRVAVMMMLGGTLVGALLAGVVFHDQVIRIIDTLKR